MRKSYHDRRNARHRNRSGAGRLRFGLGGILGAIVGALAGCLAGAIVAVAGAIGGALIGDRVTRRRRHLTVEEMNFAKEIFRDSIDYSRIVITRDSILSIGAPKTIGNTIHLKSNSPWNNFVGDMMTLSEPRGNNILIHEMGHVWQYQNGGLAYIPKSLWAQLAAAVRTGSRRGAYDWESMHAAGVPWGKWNPEQQASAIEDYFIYLRMRGGNHPPIRVLIYLEILRPYMRNVRNREGAPHF